MFRCFKDSFHILNQNMILLTPFVLFLLLFSLYFGLAQNIPHSFFSYFLSSITIISMVSAFFSGWLNMIKKAIFNYHQNLADDLLKAKASLRLLKEFPIGIGENFLVFVWTFAIQFSLLFATIFFIKFVGLKFIGAISTSPLQLQAAMASPATLNAFLNSLNIAEAMRITYWNLLLLIVLSTLSFLTMFYLPSVIYQTQNPIKALWANLLFVFKYFWSNLWLFLLMVLIHMFVSSLLTLLMNNVILSFISTLLYFYTVAYLFVLVLFYYEQKNKA